MTNTCQTCKHWNTDAAIEHLRQWSDQLHKGCISLADNAATITEGGA